jgi:hypothetical protein
MRKHSIVNCGDTDNVVTFEDTCCYMLMHVCIYGRPINWQWPSASNMELVLCCVDSIMAWCMVSIGLTHFRVFPSWALSTAFAMFSLCLAAAA